MPHTISHHMKLPLLAGACALAISFTPAFAAGGGGHVGAMTTSPSVARPMVAPPDHPTGSPVDTNPHAPFRKLNNPSQPQPANPDASSHGPTELTKPTPPTGTRLPPSIPSSTAPQLDPPPG